MNHAIVFQNMSFSYDCIQILRSISGEILSGGITALFGPNGSGKTTLLKCLAGLLPVKQGNVTVLDHNIRRLSTKEIGRLMAYVPQEHSVSFPFSVEEVVLMGRTPHLGGVMGPKHEDMLIAHAAIESIGIDSLIKQPYTELSGGQRQMVLIARALAQDSPIIILDEPTSALDFKNQLRVWRIMRKLKEDGKTIVACTHDPNHVLWFCDQVLVLNEGTILANGAVQEILSKQMLSTLYGDVCQVDNGIIKPKQCR